MATGQYERQALKQLQTTDDMSVADVVNQLDLEGVPVKDEFSLVQMSGTLRVAIMKEAWEKAGRSYDEPGTVDQYWFEDREMLLIDFNND